MDAKKGAKSFQKEFGFLIFLLLEAGITTVLGLGHKLIIYCRYRPTKQANLEVNILRGEKFRSKTMRKQA